MITKDINGNWSDNRCQFNPGVVCSEWWKCRRCGWNPDVDKKRREGLHEKVEARLEQRRQERAAKISKAKTDQSYFKY